MTSTVIPTYRYRDAPRMIAWLCDALGFARHAVYEDGKGGIAHAQLTLGPGMIMLGSYYDDDGTPARPPEAARAFNGAYLVVPDADAVYATARAAGADVVRAIQTEDYGGRGFAVRDPEGQVWSIGSYDPWHETS